MKLFSRFALMSMLLVPGVAMAAEAGHGHDAATAGGPMWLSAIQFVSSIVVFLILLAGWCLLARAIGTNRRVTDALERIEHWLVPAVFIGLGLYILIESGVVPRLIGVLT